MFRDARFAFGDGARRLEAVARASPSQARFNAAMRDWMRTDRVAIRESGRSLWGSEPLDS